MFFGDGWNQFVKGCGNVSMTLDNGVDYTFQNVRHISKEMSSNLEAKNKEYMFVVYSEQSKAYKLLGISTNKILFNRDVIVDEKIPLFSINDNFTNSRVWVTTFDFGTIFDDEIKQDTSKASNSRGV